MSRVVIFDKTATDFSSRGLGVLKNTICCKPFEYKNGAYECYLEYPIMDNKSDLIQYENIIYCNTPRGYQPFRIYQISKNDNDMILEVYAMHIFYDLRDNIVEDTNIVGASAVNAIDQILNKTQYKTPFAAGGDYTVTSNSRLVRKNPAECILGDDDNSIINRFGGEIERDNFNIKIYEKYGENRGVVVKYAKDITGLEVKCDMSTVVTRIMPEGYNGFFLPEKYVDSSLINNYTHPKIAEYDFSDVKVKGYYEGDDEDIIQNTGEGYKKLRELSKKLFTEEHIDVPETTVSISLVNLKKTNEYKDLSVLVTIYPFDTITIRHKPLGVDIEVQMNYWQYDSLNDEYITMEFGNAKNNIANTTNSINVIADNLTKEQANLLTQAKENATNLLNNGLGGYVIKTRDELLIMDTDDINTAREVWRWNKNGLGYSSTGYNGTYGTAITADGQIVADKITTGILTAIIIQNVSKTFKIDLSGDNGAQFYNNNLLSMAMSGNKIKFYNWGKEGDYIGSIGCVNTQDSSHPNGNPDKPNITIKNDFDSSISLSYTVDDSTNTSKKYILFDKYKVQDNTDVPITICEDTQINKQLHMKNYLKMHSWTLFLSDNMKASLRPITVNQAYTSTETEYLWVDNKLWVAKTQVTGGDYAEMFEWLDENTENEDRIGYLVELEGDKIIKANGTDILGIISGTASVVGDNANEWVGKYKTDKWGRYLLDDEGNKIINKDFDESKEYLDRSSRKEWGTVGLVGKIICRSDGSLNVGDYVQAINGIATKSTEKTNIKVINIIDDETVKVFIR